MKTYGYVRVSSQDQNEARQMIALQEVNTDQISIYVDKQSGKDFNRPQYQRMVKRLKAGDLLYIHSIDRLGRDYEEIQEQWRFLTKVKQVDICVISMPLLDTRRNDKDILAIFIADMMLQIRCFVAHTERDDIKKRQAEGIAAAKADGKHLGRPMKKLPENFEQVMKDWKAGKITLKEAQTLCGMKKSTFYRRKKEYELLNSKDD